ncbi:MAG: nucleotidyltransferase domain-containing protein [Candidatus Micrarchaeota archaeon]
MGENYSLEGLKSFFRRLGEKMSVERGILFGSRAWGGAEKDSDYDLIIVSKDFAGQKFYERAVGLRQYWHIDAPVDLICFTPEEFDERAGGANIVSEALKKGVAIV